MASILRLAGPVVVGVDVLEVLDADAVLGWSRAAAASLELRRGEIDELNVFPVPDGDTGTNLALTIRAGADELGVALLGGGGAARGVGAALELFAHGAVLGARGNSGVIVAQFLRGLAESTAGLVVCDAAAFAAALQCGSEWARAAVAEPVEGTVVSVARAMAAAAGSAPDLGSQLRAVVVAGAAAVRRTPEQLPVLARAGVVDAGGHGLVVILDALARAVTGERGSTAPPARAARTTQALDGSREAGRVAYAYEVQYLLDAPEAAVRTLRTDLAGFADSVAVVGTGEGVWNVHAHVNDVGAAIEAGIQAGRPHRITVVRFAADADADGGGGGGDVLGPALVAVAPGEGLAHLFAAEGVHVVGGSAEHPPSVEDVLSAILATGARDIVLLPNASQVTGVAEAAAQRSRAGGSRVAVIPTRSPVQGLAAVAVHDRSGRFDDDVVAMAEAAAATRFAEITIAGRQALTAVGICQAGDVLGLIDGEVVEVGRGLVSVAFALVDRLLGVGVELMTVLVGSTAVTGIGALIAEHVRDRSAFTEVVVYAAEQPDHPLIIGAE